MTHSVSVLVTGGAGMIGSNLVKRLVETGYRPLVVDDLSRGRLEYLQDKDGRSVIDIDNDFHQLNLESPDLLAPLLEGIEYVYHLADAVGGIDYVFKNQGLVFRRNILINSNVVDTIKKHRKTIKGFIYVGTACSFPAYKQTRTNFIPLREDDQYPASPESAYGWSKLMGEYEALLMEKEFGIPVSILSLHNVYGHPCEYETSNAQVIPSLIRKAVRYPQEGFEVWGSGNQGRAFVHVDDIVDALISTLHNGLGRELIQIGPDTCTSIREIAETVVDISGKEIAIHYNTDQPEGDEWRCADYSKAKAILNWAPKVELRDGLTRLYRWIEQCDKRQPRMSR